MKVDIDSSARLIYEAIQQLGWNVNAQDLIRRVKRLDLGMPTEDELAFILSWLGKCSLIHKLDQKQYPPTSAEKYKIPDLFCCFVTDVGPLPVLIEVKTSVKKKLSWKETYLERLKNYSSLIDLPILVAWKFYHLWFLVDLNCFEKARTNYHLSFNTAAKNNLMSWLAGDFVFIMKPKVGLHFHIKKERLLSSKQLESSTEELWELRIEKAFFVNSEGNEMSNLPSGLWPLFISAEPAAEDRVEDDYIYQSFTIPEDSGMHFAHAALPILINFPMGFKERIHWRKHLIQHEFPVDFKIFGEAVNEGIKEGFVKYGLFQKPERIPSFLKHLKPPEQWQQAMLSGKLTFNP